MFDRRVVTLLSCVALAACSQNDTSDADLAVQISALSAADVTNVHVTVSGPGMANLDADLVEVGSVYRGTIGGIPVGSGRVFTADATDTSGTVLFHGQSAPVAIVAGQTALVDLQLTQTMPPDPFHNHAPVIDSLFVSAQAVAPGDTVSFSAAAHDDDGDPLTIAWTGGGAFSPANALATTWTAPATEGTYTEVLTVTDPKGAFDVVSVTLDVHTANAHGAATVKATVDTSPIVENIVLGVDRLTPGGTTAMQVNAFDADSNLATFAWSSDCGLTFSPANDWTGTFTVPAYTGMATCTLRVDVTDSAGAANFGELVVPVGPGATPNAAPVIDTTFQSTDTVDNGGTVVLRATAHDPEGSAVSFVWSADFGTIASETDTVGSTNVTWQAPSCFQGSANVTLAVQDDVGNITSTTFHIGAIGSACVASCTRLLTAPSPVISVFNDGLGLIYTSGATGFWALDGGPPTEFALINTSGYNTGSVFTTAGGRVFYAVSFEPGTGAIRSVLPNGAGDQLVSGSEAYQAGIVSDGTYVYWARSYPGLYAIRRTPIAGGAVETIADAGAEPRGLVLVGGVLYWTAHNDGALYSLPTDLSQPRRTVLTLPGLESMATDGTRVYYTTDAGDIFAYSPTTNTVSELFMGAGTSYGSLLVAGGFVYLSASTGDLLRVSVGGGAPTVVTHINGLSGITADSASIYAASSVTNDITICSL